MRRTRILVADSTQVFRCGVRALLARESDFELVEAGDLAQVLAVIEEDCPDIALIDLELPPVGGVEAVSRLAGACHCETVVWSFEPTREAVLAAIRAGASGYLEKRISPGGLVRALRGIRNREAALSRDLASLMIEALHDDEQRERARERAAALSAREREVLGLVATGARNRQIAESLYISEFTVKRHVQNILYKLGLPSRRAAAAFYASAFSAAEPVGGRT
jgi:two-component system, NarL family, nitrate/nitrite response regulator NarL